MTAKPNNEFSLQRFDDITIFETEAGQTRIELRFENVCLCGQP